MMYASKITIDYNPQKVKTYREIELPDRLLTIEDIGKHIKEGEKFCFFQREEGGLGLHVDYISIHGYRYETKEEVAIRVAKAEKYNKNYEKHHSKYGR